MFASVQRCARISPLSPKKPKMRLSMRLLSADAKSFVQTGIHISAQTKTNFIFLIYLANSKIYIEMR